MKNVWRMPVFVVLLLTGMIAKASDGFNVRVTENQNLLVEMDRVEEGTILFLQDNDGNILYKDSIMLNESFRKVFNLEIIPRGTYFLNVEKENRILSTVLVKNSEGISIKEDVSGIVFKPYYKVEEEKVKFFLSNPEGNKVWVRVYDEGGVEIGSIFSSSPVIKRTFDFSEVPSGNYNVQVKTKSRSFLNKLTVD